MREPGYYWVKFKRTLVEDECWATSFWDGKHWDEYYTDSETSEINETRILNPDEVKEK